MQHRRGCRCLPNFAYRRLLWGDEGLEYLDVSALDGSPYYRSRISGPGGQWQAAGDPIDFLGLCQPRDNRCNIIFRGFSLTSSFILLTTMKSLQESDCLHQKFVICGRCREVVQPPRRARDKSLCDQLRLMDFARKVVRALEVPHTQEEGTPSGLQFVSSDDLLPVPVEERTWTAFSYVAFWGSTWMVTSGMIVLGMSWWQAWLCIWIGYGIITPFVVLMGRPGAVFHITFPVVNRASFGIFGSLWCIFNRATLACIWYGVQSSIGGSCVLVMLRAIWPSVNNIPNSMPSSSGTNTRDFMCFFIFWVISLPFIWPPVHKIRHFFTFKTIVAPIACLIFMIWCIVKAKGVGPIVKEPATIHGSELAWAMISGFGVCISNTITLTTNAPDFGSRARSPSAPVVSQLCSSSKTIYGETIWSPVDLLGKFLDDNPSPATRFGVSLNTGWHFALMGILWHSSCFVPCPIFRTNISANSVSAGCDLTALFPRFILSSLLCAVNIRRGGYISAIVGLVMCPWNLVSSSNRFASYMSAYSVFLSAIAGVMATEYWLVRKGHYNVADLYVTRKGSWYWYNYGFNPRAYAAYVAGIAINVVGFAGDTGTPVPAAATHIFELSFFTGFGTSSIAYYILNRIFPVPGAADIFEEIDVSGYEKRMMRSDEDTNSKDEYSTEKESSTA
ncbi:permease for cytosine/purines, uracil, thiamine, allantoin-domain-containing protein [Suillus clintonianus]|uniref:permease for cytosine/purines, uracil, thiamine, allantoin-domain-containing protein n=1 Tax=Suillus clintonianus TaxID=1904413 RepID=UPI001B85C2ED|nr:permease for cytosine/purines, uracil, thiamine, allantoin-domain-containing protein [Suillus clintonianus]KAG2142440.1 permease for cytosine/purines, uracil, thiamine, allantoin-domain-containing protein [Suillus clintonianus]